MMLYEFEAPLSSQTFSTRLCYGFSSMTSWLPLNILFSQEVWKLICIVCDILELIKLVSGGRDVSDAYVA